MCAVLADNWHWQPSELYELDVEDLAEWFEELQDINVLKAKAIKEAQQRR